MKKTAKKIVLIIRRIFFSEKGKREVLFLLGVQNVSKPKSDEIKRRILYFAPDITIVETEKIKFRAIFNFDRIAVLDGRKLPAYFIIKKDEIYNLDYNSHSMDGWDYHRLLTSLNREIVEKGICKGKNILKAEKEKLYKYNLSYVFGTGASLENASEKTWDDGLRIVCNTIVKDKKLWHHINPNFIVAGDAIYHFGISSFARKFREDLKQRLAETNTFFLFPSIFHPFCLREFEGFEERLIPVPTGNLKTVHHDLTIKYELPGLGNVLPLLLLPLACTYTKEICLWGFDGRVVGDKMFWKNSSKHFYSGDVEDIVRLHPAFFEALLPKEKEESYVKKVHGDALDISLLLAEKMGFRFNMLHPSHTPVLQKRYLAK